MFSISEAKIVGTAGDSEWSQVHSFIPAKEKLNSHGVLFLVLSIQVKSKEGEKYDLAMYGKEAIQRFHEEYYSAEGVGFLHSHLQKVISTIDKEFSEIGKSIIAGVVLPKSDAENKAFLYIATNNKQCRANLMREERIYRFDWEDKDQREEIDTEVLGISGEVKRGDILIFGTYDLFASFSNEVLEQALSVMNVSEAQSIISPLVHERNGNSGAAGIIVGFGGIEQKLIREDKQGKKSKEILETKGKKNLIFKIMSALGLIKSASVVGRILPSRIRLKDEKLVIKEENVRKRKMMYSVAFMLLVMLGVSIFFGYRKRVEQERNEKFKSVWDVVEHQYAEAEALVELNPLRAKSLLIEAKSLIEETKEQEVDYLSNQQLKKLADKLEETKELLSHVSGEYKLDEAQVFLDLALVRPNTYGEKMDMHGNTLVVLDTASKVILSINLDSKASEIIGGGQFFSGVKSASIYAERAFVISDSGIIEIAVKGKTSKVVVDKDPEWGEIVDMTVFGGNLYLLDRGQKEIFRYQTGDGSFDSRQRWLGEGVFPDLSQAKSLAIDGDVWVLNGDSVLRFRRGVQENFVLSGFDDKLSDAVSLYTDSDVDNLYVLDRGNGRIVVFDKNGEYQEQYIWEGVDTVSDLVVSEDRGRMYLLAAAEIFEVELK